MVVFAAKRVGSHVTKYVSPVFIKVSFAGWQIGLPSGALHASMEADPRLTSVGNGLKPVEVEMPVASFDRVAVASPVGTATCRVVACPLIVVSIRPAIAPVKEAEAVAVADVVAEDEEESCLTFNTPATLP